MSLLIVSFLSVNIILDLCNKAKNGIRCLCRVRKFLTFNQAILLFNSYILSVFNYCPIIWMFCNETTNYVIISTHKRALRAILHDYHSNYSELLTLSSSVSIHEMHLRFLAVEIYKTINNLNPSFFELKTISYNFRKGNLLKLPTANSSAYGTSSFLFRGSLLWNALPKSIKSSSSINTFKSAIHKCNLSAQCGCKICRL